MKAVVTYIMKYNNKIVYLKNKTIVKAIIELQPQRILKRTII